MAYPSDFGVDTSGIDFGDTFLPGAGSPTYGTYDFLPRDQFSENFSENFYDNFYNAQSNPGGGFFNQFGQFVNKAGQLIPQIGKIVGAVGDIARIGSQGDPGIFGTNVTESTKKIREEQDKTYADIQGVFKNIAGVTGVSTEDAVQQYYKQFSNAIEGLTAQGRADLREDPDISKQYATLRNRITQDQTQYSNLNNPRFAAAYKAADAVASIDPNAIKNVMTLGPAYKEQYSYEDPESQRAKYGRGNAIRDIASFYANDPNLNQYMVSANDPNLNQYMVSANDPNLNQFMVSATDPNIQNLMNYS